MNAGRFCQLIAVLIMIVISIGCGSREQVSAQETAAIGTISKQEMSSYMYGSHALINDSGSVTYALSSDSLDLDSYVGKKMTVRGATVAGYPVDGGPAYLHVHAIE